MCDNAKQEILLMLTEEDNENRVYLLAPIKKLSVMLLIEKLEDGQKVIAILASNPIMHYGFRRTAVLGDDPLMTVTELYNKLESEINQISNILKED
jgi:hypothetical protein